jgi:hypothetical protein
MTMSLFVAALASLALTTCGDRVLYRQPQFVNLSSQAWADPTAVLPTDQTQLVFWRMGKWHFQADLTPYHTCRLSS